jgi:CheY-like chemotaxis protein
VQAQAMQPQDGHVTLEFSVEDSGVGLTTEQQSFLFQPFSQADSSTTRDYGGTGLGLSIVRSLAELMHGEVGVASEIGRGSRFWFRVRLATVAPQATLAKQNLPLKSAETVQPPASAARESVPLQLSKRRAHLLIAEDNAVNRMVIGAMLGNIEHYEMTTDMVEDGQQAVDFITHGSRPDLVLMDMQMPLLDGLAATAQIRAWEAEFGKFHLPIVALTANAFEDDRQACFLAGMDDFLAKPLDISQLEVMLQRYLK